MNVSSIGLTTVTPTTGTPAQQPEQSPAGRADETRGGERQQTKSAPAESGPRLLPASELKTAALRGYGDFVDKHV